tara:strand:- start:457 stop:747 length:291 start_codon:yes stop_codon:yes gene_type:complete
MEIINSKSPIIYEQIKSKCKDNGISISKLCEMADISRDTLANWKTENPGTIKTLFAIEKIFSELKAIQPGENGFYCMNVGDSCSSQCRYCENKTSK